MAIIKKARLLIRQEKKWLIVFLIVAIPRVIYSIFTLNTTQDSFFYLNIAENIKNGCGFSYTNDLGYCEPLIGGYFPGYPYFLHIFKSIGFSNKAITIFVSILISCSITYFLKTIENIGIREKKIFIFAFLIGFSPISMGYSRFLLIDPILYFFSILLIAEFIKLKHQPKKISFNFLRIAIVSIFSIYFKPTLIILVVPHFLLIFSHFGIKKFIKYSIVYFFILIISISPWFFKNLNNSSKIFQENSNAAPANVKGLVNWLATFSLTEYENASALYPIYSHEDGDRKKVIINTKFNPYISQTDKDFKQVNEILKKENPNIKRGFTDEEKIFLNKLAKSRSKNNGFLGNTFLYSIKIISTLLHPLNSWGWPISVNLNAEYSLTNFSLNLKLFFKFIIFLYRLILFYFYFGNLFFLAKNININKFYSKRNQNIIKQNIFLVTTFLILCLNIFLYIGLFGLLEHRYFYPVMPWIEFSLFLKILEPKKLENISFQNII